MNLVRSSSLTGSNGTHANHGRRWSWLASIAARNAGTSSGRHRRRRKRRVAISSGRRSIHPDCQPNTTWHERIPTARPLPYSNPVPRGRRSSARGLHPLRAPHTSTRRITTWPQRSPPHSGPYAVPRNRATELACGVVAGGHESWVAACELATTTRRGAYGTTRARRARLPIPGHSCLTHSTPPVDRTGRRPDPRS